MKEAIIYVGETVRSEVVESPIPVPKENEVLIKVIVSGTNPKDWKWPMYTNTPMNSGDDIAGYVESVGANVVGFTKGDRVAAFHKMGTAAGSFAEYAIAYDYSTFLIPPETSFEEAATIPLAALTAAYGLFDTLKLPTPWVPADTEIPLLVYGASTSVGAFAIKLAKLAGISPVIGVAGKAKDFAASIGADHVADYRGNADLAKDIREGLKAGQKLEYAWDTISEKGSYLECIKALEPHSKLSLILPERQYPDLSADVVDFKVTSVAAAHGDSAAQRDFGYVFYKQVSKWLAEGKFSGHPYRVVEGGLNGIGKALGELKDGKVSGFKYVVRIADTK